jgi:hypothetical protein
MLNGITIVEGTGYSLGEEKKELGGGNEVVMVIFIIIIFFSHREKGICYVERRSKA